MNNHKYLVVWLICFCLCITLAAGAQTKNHTDSPLQVIVFMDTECPVTQGYMPDLKKLSGQYAATVHFESVFPAYTATDKEIKDFLKKYDLKFSGYPDKGHTKTKRYHAKVMPEAILLNAQGMIVYQGAIDNLYAGLGRKRTKATEFYLRDAIEATINGEAVLVKKTEAVGCLIND